MRFYTKQHEYYCGIDLHAKESKVRALLVEVPPNQYKTSYTFIHTSLFIKGICLELLQGMIEYRKFAYTDMLAKGMGILLALYLAKIRLVTYLIRLDTWLSTRLT